MKVLSLKQPFAELVVSGKKTIELRNWNTKFRGMFLIHASLRPDLSAMKKFGFVELPMGKIIGEAELINVKEYNTDKEHQMDNDKHLADARWGKFGFVLEHPKRIKSISVKGKLGFWEYEL